MPDRFTPKSLLKKPVALPAADSLKLVVTATEDGKGKRPHQAFLVLKDTETGLEAPFTFTTKENGKAVVEIVRSRATGWQSRATADG